MWKISDKITASIEERVATLTLENFDWKFYIKKYPDLLKSGINTELKAKQHYILHGIREKRKPTPNSNGTSTVALLETKKEPSTVKENDSNFVAEEQKDVLNLSVSQLASQPSLNKLVVSILLFNPTIETSLKFLQSAPRNIVKNGLKVGFKNIVFQIKNHTKGVLTDEINHICNFYNKEFENVEEEKIEISFVYEESYNMGYGEGHNSNLLKHTDADYYFILNDDMGFPHMDWFPLVFESFNKNDNIGIIGADQSPGYISDHGDGSSKNINNLENIEYIEGSLLIIRGDLFRKLKGYDDHYKYFYYEDVDLNLRARQLGWGILGVEMPHQHFRSNSARTLPGSLKNSICEHNRAKFLSRWSEYLKRPTRNLTNNILIKLVSDGMGDICDCYYVVKHIINKFPHSNIYLYMPNSSLNFLYESLNVNLIEEGDISKREYDSIYSTEDLNFAVPVHTLDLLSARLGQTEVDTDPKDLLNYIDSLKNDSYEKIQGSYIVMHLDSQRSGFEGRMPNSDCFIPLIEELKLNYKLVLIGKTYEDTHPFYNGSFERFLQDTFKQTSNVVDYRGCSLKDSFIAIKNSNLFIGVDSGPSHFAQAMDVPSFVIYGPINPATKIYRFHNSGCWFNLDLKEEAGAYHILLEPDYHYDLRRDIECINVNGNDLVGKIKSFIKNAYKFNWNGVFNSLRDNQRDYLLTQIHNPGFYNKTILRSPHSITLGERVQQLQRIMAVYEDYAIQIVNKNK